MNTEQERAAFEAWFARAYPYDDIEAFEKRMALDAWMERAALQSQDRKDAEQMYYLQDTRSYVGNCPMWWALNGNGYTTRLDEAQRYTLDEAMRQHRSRPSDVPWPCSKIDTLQRPTVDIQHMGSINSQIRALEAIDHARRVEGEGK